MAEEPPLVVVGVDDPDPSRAAMRWAADEAVDRSAEGVRRSPAAGDAGGVA